MKTIRDYSRRNGWTWAALRDLHAGRNQNLCNNTRLEVDHPEVGCYAILFHNRPIVVYYPDGRVMFDSWGFNRSGGGFPQTADKPSSTTKQRMTLFAPGAVGIYQHKHEWFIYIRDVEKPWGKPLQEIPFEDGVTYYPEPNELRYAEKTR